MNTTKENQYKNNNKKQKEENDTNTTKEATKEQKKEKKATNTKPKFSTQEVRRKNFLNSLSDAEAALFIEHAKDDEEPSTSSGVYHALSGIGPAAVASRHLVTLRGALDDRRRLGLSGAASKRYVRYLQKGKTPEVARELALAIPSSGQNKATAPASERKGGHQYNKQEYSRKQTTPADRRTGGHNSDKGRDALADKRGKGHHQDRRIGETAPAGKRKSGHDRRDVKNSDEGKKERGSDESAPAAKRKSGHLTPQTPNPKNQREQPPPQESGPKGRHWEPTSSRGGGGQTPSYSDAVRGIRVAVLPRDYLAEALSPEELTTLQDAITD
ncbi:PREDICTED: uncharacterized protein LOC108355362 [Rhagoletis zephyria]|uniref:uncharacterized protein LOC108355362 n=1 Tax=Rhagoletis zephyria TaxID=28612 RepID=UPI000811A881|nr:PREDICTED: uncharacterized protein LOC108355362 [Rhagoletis zephyria]